MLTLQVTQLISVIIRVSVRFVARRACKVSVGVGGEESIADVLVCKWHVALVNGSGSGVRVGAGAVRT